MTDAELAAARALVDAATPGPWRKQQWKNRTDADVFSGGDVFLAHLHDADNAAFIAASRTLVLQLLDEVKRSHADNAVLLVAADADANRSRLATAMNQIARLTAGLEEATAVADRFAADVERVLPVYEAAKAWRVAKPALLDRYRDFEDVAIGQAVDAALAAETRAK